MCARWQGGTGWQFIAEAIKAIKITIDGTSTHFQHDLLWQLAMSFDDVVGRYWMTMLLDDNVGQSHSTTSLRGRFNY